ncbi:MAG: hypothetical protein P8Y14_20685 [Anaerolineales bacterium]|jgi:hypothetical protein
MNPYFDISLSSSVVAGYTIDPGTAERRLEYEQSNAHLELEEAQMIVGDTLAASSQQPGILSETEN